MKCGRPAPAESTARMCDPCETVFLNTDAIEPNRRKRKERSVLRFQGRRVLYLRGLSLVAGLNDLYDGQPLVGALLNLTLLFSLVSIFWLERFTVTPGPSTRVRRWCSLRSRRRSRGW